MGAAAWVAPEAERGGGAKKAVARATKVESDMFSRTEILEIMVENRSLSTSAEMTKSSGGSKKILVDVTDLVGFIFFWFSWSLLARGLILSASF